MPLTDTGQQVKSKMRKTYGKKIGDRVFYASINKKKPGSQNWHYPDDKNLPKNEALEDIEPEGYEEISSKSLPNSLVKDVLDYTKGKWTISSRQDFFYAFNPSKKQDKINFGSWTSNPNENNYKYAYNAKLNKFYKLIEDTMESLTIESDELRNFIKEEIEIEEDLDYLKKQLRHNIEETLGFTGSANIQMGPPNGPIPAGSGDYKKVKEPNMVDVVDDDEELEDTTDEERGGDIGVQVGNSGKKIKESDNEPEEGDYVLQGTGYLGSKTLVSQVGESKSFGTFNDDEDAIAEIKKHMKQKNFYPNIWILSDHGNYHLVQEDIEMVNSGKIYKDQEEPEMINKIDVDSTDDTEDEERSGHTGVQSESYNDVSEGEMLRRSAEEFKSGAKKGSAVGALIGAGRGLAKGNILKNTVAGGLAGGLIGGGLKVAKQKVQDVRNPDEDYMQALAKDYHSAVGKGQTERANKLKAKLDKSLPIVKSKVQAQRKADDYLDKNLYGEDIYHLSGGKIYKDKPLNNWIKLTDINNPEETEDEERDGKLTFQPGTNNPVKNESNEEFLNSLRLMSEEELNEYIDSLDEEEKLLLNSLIEEDEFKQVNPEEIDGSNPPQVGYMDKVMTPDSEVGDHTVSRTDIDSEDQAEDEEEKEEESTDQEIKDKK